MVCLLYANAGARASPFFGVKPGKIGLQEGPAAIFHEYNKMNIQGRARGSGAAPGLREQLVEHHTCGDGEIERVAAAAHGQADQGIAEGEQLGR